MIEIEDLWKSYGSHKVIKGLFARIEKGKTLVVLGRSGVGKSVLLKLIIGITKADKGVIRIDNTLISELKGEKKYKAIRNMGMLFQGAALFDSMNIEENIAFYLRQHGNPLTGKRYTKKELNDMVSHALEIVDLAGTEKKMPSDLSGGMRKRVGIARLIVYRPKYLLYDEPTTGLDPITAMQINELIVKTQNELQATSIVVTHDIISALFVGDQLALHKDGVLAYMDKPDLFLQIDDPVIAFLKQTIEKDPRSFRRKNR